MALLDEKTLLKLPVYTRNGSPLGRVVGFDIDIDTQQIVRYRVRPRGLAARVVTSPLLVAREQVAEITEEKMVVEDAVGKEMELAKAKAIGLISGVKA